MYVCVLEEHTSFIKICTWQYEISSLGHTYLFLEMKKSQNRKISTYTLYRDLGTYTARRPTPGKGSVPKPIFILFLVIIYSLQSLLNSKFDS